MAAPTVYKWTDTGAPQITRNDEADYQALFQAILIDGYGSQTPPGSGANKWSIPYSNATSFILKQGGTSSKKACIKFHTFGTNSNSYARVDVADDFSDLNTPINQWSGFHHNDTLPLGYSTSNSYNIPWIIVATERVLICQFGYQNTNRPAVFDTANNPTYLQNHHWYFGDYKCEEPSYVNNQIVIHTRTTTSTTSAWTDAFTSSSNTNDMICRVAASYNDTYNGEIEGYPMWTRPILEDSSDIGSNRTNEYIPQYPSPLNGGLYLEKWRFIAHGAIMGELYGVLIPLQRRPYPTTAGVYSFTGQGDYTGENIDVYSSYNGQYMIRTGADWGVE